LHRICLPAAEALESWVETVTNTLCRFVKLQPFFVIFFLHFCNCYCLCRNNCSWLDLVVVNNLS